MINNIHQILITKEPEKIPEVIQGAITSVKNAFNHCTYTLYDNEKIIELIKNNFDINTLKAYNKIKAFAGKADLAKYCINYLKGGWYVDISILMSPFAKVDELPERIDFLGFRDIGHGLRPNTLSYGICPSLFYSKSNNIVLEKAIELVIENCKNEDYGLTSICPTGPGVLGRAIATFGLKQSQVLGLYMPLTPNHQQMNISYVLPDGHIFALHKTSWLATAKPADISAFGFKSTNNYMKLYLEEDYYDKSITIK